MREQLRADALLAKMDLVSDLAALHDEARDRSLRAIYAAQYRRLIGVSPSNRQAFQAALERIVAGGRQSIADVLTAFPAGHDESVQANT